MTDGWIKLHRKSIKSTVWTSPVIWMVWCWCLLKASHDTQKFPFNGSDIDILPGQFITGRKKALGELADITPQQWRTAMTYLKSTSRITIKTTNKFSLVTVLKWHEYQDKPTPNNQQSNQPLTNEQPTTNQPITTYKKKKNDKNDEEGNKKKYKDGDTIILKDGTIGLLYFGRWVDSNNKNITLDRGYYTELP